MTNPLYADYLGAVRTLVDQADALAADLARAQQIGVGELDSAARAVRQAEEDSRSVGQRLRVADDDLARLTREVGLDLESAPPSQAAPTTLADADRLLGELRRELSALERSCDWVRRQRTARSQAMASAPVVAATPVSDPAAQVGSQASAETGRPVWKSPLVWVVVVLAVLLVVVLVLVLT